MQQALKSNQLDPKRYVKQWPKTAKHSPRGHCFTCAWGPSRQVPSLCNGGFHELHVLKPVSEFGGFFTILRHRSEGFRRGEGRQVQLKLSRCRDVHASLTYKGQLVCATSCGCASSLRSHTNCSNELSWDFNCELFPSATWACSCPSPNLLCDSLGQHCNPFRLQALGYTWDLTSAIQSRCCIYLLAGGYETWCKMWQPPYRHSYHCSKKTLTKPE